MSFHRARPICIQSHGTPQIWPFAPGPPSAEQLERMNRQLKRASDANGEDRLARKYLRDDRRAVGLPPLRPRR